MTDTFTYRVHATASGGGEFKVAAAQFGDGYSQRAADGMNNESQKWNVTVEGYRATIDEILAFIRDKQGAESFYWTPPLGVEGFYVCKRYNPQDQGGGLFTLALEFEQVFSA